MQNLHSGDMASCIGWLITKKRPTSLIGGERHRWWLQANLGPWVQAAPAWPGEGLDNADNGGGELTMGVTNSRDGDSPAMSRVTAPNGANVETSKFHKFFTVLLHSFCAMNIRCHI